MSNALTNSSVQVRLIKNAIEVNGMMRIQADKLVTKYLNNTVEINTNNKNTKSYQIINKQLESDLSFKI